MWPLYVTLCVTYNYKFVFLVTTKNFSSWEQMNKKEMETLLSRTASMSEPVFLLGGFSTGPAISGAGITGDFPNNFALAGAAGMSYQFQK